MSKRYKSRIILTSVICFAIGLLIGFIGNIFLSLPSSYKIPQRVEAQKTFEAAPPNTDIVRSSDISIHFLELGNKYTGDCIYIKVGSYDILVDGGSKTGSVNTITNYIDPLMTDNKMDFIIITHAHEDHYAGYATNSNTESLFDHYRSNGKTIGTIITFAETKKTNSQTMQKNYLRELSEAALSGAEHFTALECYKNTVNYQDKQAQNIYNLGEDSNGNTISLQILYQKYYEKENFVKTSTENNASVCFQIIQGSKKYLFTGDLEKEGEESLVESNNLTPVELYKAGHHGSKTSSSKELMEVIQPKIVVVCCVAGSSEYTTKNENQFPTQEFVNNVSIYTRNIYVTSLCYDYQKGEFGSFNGNITVCSSGSNDTQVFCSVSSEVLCESDWFKSNRTLPEGAK